MAEPIDPKDCELLTYISLLNGINDKTLLESHIAQLKVTLD